VNRSREFYTQMLGFGIAVDAPPPVEHAEHGRISEALQGGIVLINGNMLLGLRPAAPAGDRFDENRVGLDHRF
jgi:glyoxylase I family protein